MQPSQPRLTVVLLTWNEERNVRACLDGLARQTVLDFEVVLLDAASTDRTLDEAAAASDGFPVPLRVVASQRRTTVGEARNQGVALARAPAVAFLSADAVPREDWVAKALEGLERADLVYGRQVHAPAEATLGSAVRALRYHHFDDGDHSPDAQAMASHVNAAIRADVLKAFPFGTDVAASAVDDLLLARRASRAGWRPGYEPEMVVAHRDVASARAELRKNLREGLGWGAHARELGLHGPVLAWAALVAGSGSILAAAPGPVPAIGFAGTLWLPAVRRAWRQRRSLQASTILVGAAASPAFDLAFLAAYARGLLTGARARPRPSPLQEA